MSVFVVGLPGARLSRLSLGVASAIVLTAVAGAIVSYAPAQPQVVRAGLLVLGVGALLLLVARLPVSVIPLAVVVGLLGLGNLELSRIVPGLSIPGDQETIVLLILLGLVVMGAGLDASSARRPVWPTTLLLGALFLVLSLGSLLYAQDRHLARWAVMHQVVQMAALAAGFLWVRSDQEAKGLVKALAVVGVVSAALAAWQLMTPGAFANLFGPYTDPESRSLMDYWARDIGRVGALWLFAPPLAAFLSVILPATLYVVLRRGGDRIRQSAIAAFALATLALALTGARMAVLGGAASVCVFLALWGSRRPHGARTGFVIIGVLAAGLVAASAFSAWRGSDASVLARIGSFFGTDRQVSVSVTGRRDIYGTLLEVWRSELWLGVGLGNARPVVQEVTTFNSTPHAYWLGLLVETGLIGTGLVALMLAGMIPHYRRLLKRPAEAPERAFGIFALAASTALLVGGLLDNAMLVWQIGVLFWLIQGSVLSLSLRGEEGPEASQEAARLSRAEAARAR
jgi:hypothetical protein